MDAYKQQISEASAKFPKADQTFQYGTAGFRMKAHLLPSVVFRVGLLAALRSKQQGGQTIGVMITASHNVPEDNGVKLVDPLGEMLKESWEKYATQLANAPSDSELAERYAKLHEELEVKPDGAEASVVFAKDTRESGPALVEALEAALGSVNAKYTDYGIMTTPQLHYIVRCVNSAKTGEPYGEPTEKGYYEKLSKAYNTLMQCKTKQGKVTVDCANGVGAPKLKELAAVIGDSLDVEIANTDTDDYSKLNSQCGADFVKTGQRLPVGTDAKPGERYASLDGDADRIVYYYVDDNGTFHLLDGDKIATLAASFITDLARQSGLPSDDIRIGVVQTAYANGSSTAYITKSLGLPVVCTPTGVKWLHAAAHSFDCGVYFEANGHGTVLFSQSFIQAIESREPKSPGEKSALDSLKALTELINQTVGDALSDLLMVEVILAHKKWSPRDWDGCYQDLPNKLVRVVVKDRGIYKTTDAERKLEEPAGLQGKIDELVAKYKNGRSFARASGTEDAVRVYAEAATQTEANELAMKVAELLS